ncbi:MAG TPA: S8 family serine peptidase [Rhodanobacteraceae bacterium]|nr:S8 family serine peptidase [Rhodanobacteraceae bacterium]
MKNAKVARRANRTGEWLALGVLAGTLAACGGGGNGGVRALPASPPPPPPPPPTQPTTPQPPIDAQLSLTNTYAAHAAGYDGSGVTIGVVDSGIMASNPAVAGRVKAELIYVDPSQNNVNIDDVVGHGTWVSEIAAGAPFDQFPGGIAPGADLVSARIISDNAPDDNGSTPPSTVTAADAQFFQQVNSDLISYGVSVMNNSWGGITWDTTDTSVNQAFDQAYQPFVIQHDGLVVFAAGNDSQANPSTIAALPSVAPDLERGWLTVVAINSNDPTQIEGYSNQCGIAMDYCLAAPGDVIVLDKDTTASTTNPDYYIVEGTSLAAPIVSGAAAVVWQAFPYFTNDQVRQTLLGTADDLGAAGPDPVFGYGEVDVGKAVQGPAKFDWGDFSVSFNSGTSTFSNDISGAGGLIKNGSGTLVLAGNDSYTGGTQVLGGWLQAANPLPGDVTVGTGGTLDTVPGVNGSLSNSGAVVVAGHDTSVTGNYTQTGSGVLSVSLGSKLDVTGSATLAGNLNILGVNAGYQNNSHQDVLDAGSVTGTFANLTLSQGVFLNTAIQYTPTSVWLDTNGLSITATATAMGIVDPASVGAAQRVQLGFDSINAAGGNVSNGVLAGAGAIQHSATPAVAHTSLQSLSGQLHAASAAMLFNGIDANGDALSSHFDDLLGGRAKPGVWVNNLGWNGDLQRSGYTGATFQSSGSMVGNDFRIGQHGLLGFAVGQSRGFGQLDASWDHDRTRMSNVALYGGVANGAWYANVHVATGWYREDMQRMLQLGGLGLPVGTGLAGRYMAGSLEGGRQFRFGNLQITPFADVRYQRLDQGAFAEAGGLGFGLKANARTTGRLQTGLGLRAVSGWRLGNGMWMQFDGSADWQHALHQFGDEFDASFTGFNDWLPVDGIGLSRNITTIRTGVSLWPSRGFGLRLGFAREQGSRQQSNSATLQGTLAF